ncbi:hypothetical protein [Aureimonas sp. N4]|uniref:Nmad2 family putative nucleotide modification protein n=1 Tax=Aureimonas sp. N4 TaxID=1638165 RepID=UPI000ACE0C5E|nr:hypothetical protein [Aureimonas sp. N4]
MVSFYRYVIDHDMGFSPNPFYGVCTLANCKPVIRRCIKEGDFVMGFGAAKSGVKGKLIYWMRVDGKLKFEKYWSDPAYQVKKPVVNGSLIKFYGDNIYWRDAAGVVRQEPSFHSYEDGRTNEKNLKRDTGSTDQVLTAKLFGYYGHSAIEVPAGLSEVVPKGRGHRRALNRSLELKLEAWLLNDLPTGLRAVPGGWLHGK